MSNDLIIDKKRIKANALHGPILVMIRGMPGSGKSYLASALQDLIGKEKVVLLDPDQIDKASKAYVDLSEALTAEGIEMKFHPNRFLKAKGFKAILAHQIIIWNQAFTDLGGFNRTIEPLQTFASEHSLKLPTLVVEVEVDHSVAKARIAKREAAGGHGVPEDAFARFASTYASFFDQGFNTVILDGQDDILISATTVKHALETLEND